MKKPKYTPSHGQVFACLTSLSLLYGCGGAKKKWKNAPGTQGALNLDAVKEAFQKRPNVAEFEKRVNEIFEGDNLILLHAEDIGNAFRIDAKEDLDKNEKVSDGDDLIFRMTVKNGMVTLQGMGVNSYYKESWPYDPAKEERYHRTYHRSHYRGPYFYHWYGYGGRRWGGSYYTPRDNYTSIRQHRDSYRKGSDFKTQVKQNGAYENRMASKHKSTYGTATRAPSAKRTSYVKSTAASGKFNSKTSSSGWAVRSRSGVKSSFGRSSGGFSSSSRGGFRGSSGMGV